MAKKNTLNTPAELDRAVREKGVRLGLYTFQAAATRGLEEWVGSDPAESQPTGESDEPATYSRKEQAARALLHVVFEEGTDADAEWISGNLKNFVEAIRSRKPLDLDQSTEKVRTFARLARIHKKQEKRGA